MLAFLAYLLIVDFPENSPKSWRFLSQKEADLVVARIDHDRNDVETTPFHLGSYLRNGLDSKVWGFAWLYMLTTTNTYAIAYFLPIILQGGLGFDVASAQCLVAPPYVASAIVMIIQGYLGDKLRLRGPIIIFNCALGTFPGSPARDAIHNSQHPQLTNLLLGILGLGLLGYVKQSGVRYFGVFLATIACNANCPVLLTYQSNNIRGQWKRAFTSATLIGGGAIGGIIGTSVFRPIDSPTYRPGILACLIANVIMIIIVLLLSLKFYRANKRVDAGGKQIEGYPGFKYTF